METFRAHTSKKTRVEEFVECRIAFVPLCEMTEIISYFTDFETLRGITVVSKQFARASRTHVWKLYQAHKSLEDLHFAEALVLFGKVNAWRVRVMHGEEDPRRRARASKRCGMVVTKIGAFYKHHMWTDGMLGRTYGSARLYEVETFFARLLRGTPVTYYEICGVSTNFFSGQAQLALWMQYKDHCHGALAAAKTMVAERKGILSHIDPRLIGSTK
jgi:hypothetical protein